MTQNMNVAAVVKVLFRGNRSIITYDSSKWLRMAKKWLKNHEIMMAAVVVVSVVVIVVVALILIDR